jgi:thiopurine S-methyltransferase
MAMEADFWHQKWMKNEIGFHQNTFNQLLVKHFPALSLAMGARIFLPLCGKSLDIQWLLQNGYRVVGAELSKLAVTQLFEHLGVTPTVSSLGEVECYSANNLEIFVGDIFQISCKLLGAVDAIYDRAALVALPETMRSLYVKHLMKITACAPQLLICFEYDQRLMFGPPFSVDGKEVSYHYDGRYSIALLEQRLLSGGFKGKIDAQETVWMLMPWSLAS